MEFSTAQVLFHRFFVYQSFKKHDRFIISIACLFLSAKIEEFSMKGKYLQNIVKAYINHRKKYNDSFKFVSVLKIKYIFI